MIEVIDFLDLRSSVFGQNGPVDGFDVHLRRFVLSLLKRDTSMPKTSLKRKRPRAAMNTDKLEAVLFGV